MSSTGSPASPPCGLIDMNVCSGIDNTAAMMSATSAASLDAGQSIHHRDRCRQPRQGMVNPVHAGDRALTKHGDGVPQAQRIVVEFTVGSGESFDA